MWSRRDDQANKKLITWGVGMRMHPGIKLQLVCNSSGPFPHPIVALGFGSIAVELSVLELTSLYIQNS